MQQNRFNRSKSRFSRGRPQGRPQFRAQKPRGGGDYIDPSRFINKAVITEEVERFVPEHAFNDFAIDEELKKTIATKGYTAPTPIQDRAIPHVLKGQDVVGIANTGTGKTAAFLIPLITKMRKDADAQALIVVPTRELAIQIESELKTLTQGMRIFSAVCVGGVSIVPQIRALRFRNQFIIGTPGRLKDLIEQGYLKLGRCNTLVLDEADRMLDMGFVGDMRFLVSKMPTERQTLFFSATFSSEIEKLVSEFLREPVRISVKVGDTSKNVDQDVIKVTGKPKLDLLHDLLIQKDLTKVLIFGRTKHGVERLSKTLNERGFKSESIHGNKNHTQRQRALNAFKDNKVQILVATDVAARGLDIADVSHVVNYDTPATYEDYVHRVGRAGRAGKRGKALTFVE